MHIKLICTKSILQNTIIETEAWCVNLIRRNDGFMKPHLILYRLWNSSAFINGWCVNIVEKSFIALNNRGEMKRISDELNWSNIAFYVKTTNKLLIYTIHSYRYEMNVIPKTKTKTRSNASVKRTRFKLYAFYHIMTQQTKSFSAIQLISIKDALLCLASYVSAFLISIAHINHRQGVATKEYIFIKRVDNECAIVQIRILAATGHAKDKLHFECDFVCIDK